MVWASRFIPRMPPVQALDEAFARSKSPDVGAASLADPLQSTHVMPFVPTGAVGPGAEGWHMSSIGDGA